ncbi:hypothetical protein Nepgr_020321 [Nepenthes gracilis]|uniref:Uncharacterized protein n=1 Tax=Nepenthes gracilis TaxID=150966 RepID=A0AAD3XW60_NEPGR|nr:hypothetical protein Nepgr_020321 [Nepenthes gracilis]
MGEGVAMPAMNNIISKWVLTGERSGALALIYSSMYLGSIADFVFFPILLHKFGGPSVFCSFESLRGAWVALWLSKAYGLVAILPWLTRELFANIGGWMADTLVTRGLAVTSVWKIMQSMEVLGPVFLLSLLSQMKPPVLTVLSLPCRPKLDAFSQSGLYSNHQDIGPRYSRVESKAFGQQEAESGGSWEPDATKKDGKFRLVWMSFPIYLTVEAAR